VENAGITIGISVLDGKRPPVADAEQRTCSVQARSYQGLDMIDCALPADHDGPHRSEELFQVEWEEWEEDESWSEETRGALRSSGSRSCQSQGI